MNSNIVKKVLYALTIMISVDMTYGAASNIKEAFDEKYKAWREYMDAHPEFRLYSQWMPDPERDLLFQEIVNIGLPLIPYAAIKIKEDPKEDRLWRAIRGIAKVQIVATVDKVTNKTVLPGFSGLYPGDPVDFYWWQGGRAFTERAFRNLYAQWRMIDKGQEGQQAKKMYRRIRDLGLAALPLMMHKIRQGDTELIPLVSELTDGNVKKDAMAEECIKWWNEKKEDWLIPFPNKRPIANAGNDQIVGSGQLVTLDGSASSDFDYDLLEYTWRQVGGPKVELSCDKSVMAGFNATEVEREVVLTFELIVNDGGPKRSVHPACESSQSEPATVKITIKPKE